MKIETRKVMKLSGIAIAATAAASATAYLTTRLLTREALDRDGPRVFQKAGNLISGTQSGNAFQEELRKAAEKLAQKENEDALRHCRIPVMLVHGADDHFVPLEMTYENYAACASPKKLFIVPGADHGMSYFMDREGYEAAGLDFWRQYD